MFSALSACGAVCVSCEGEVTYVVNDSEISAHGFNNGFPGMRAKSQTFLVHLV